MRVQRSVGGGGRVEMEQNLAKNNIRQRCDVEGPCLPWPTWAAIDNEHHPVLVISACPLPQPPPYRRRHQVTGSVDEERQLPLDRRRATAREICRRDSDQDAGVPPQRQRGASQPPSDNSPALVSLCVGLFIVISSSSNFSAIHRTHCDNFLREIRETSMQ